MDQINHNKVFNLLRFVYFILQQFKVQGSGLFARFSTSSSANYIYIKYLPNFMEWRGVYFFPILFLRHFKQNANVFMYNFIYKVVLQRSITNL
jgi:hypothetical protein